MSIQFVLVVAVAVDVCPCRTSKAGYGTDSTHPNVHPKMLKLEQKGLILNWVQTHYSLCHCHRMRSKCLVFWQKLYRDEVFWMTISRAIILCAWLNTWHTIFLCKYIPHFAFNFKLCLVLLKTRDQQRKINHSDFSGFHKEGDMKWIGLRLSEWNKEV